MGNKPAVSNTPAATQQASVTSEQDEFAKDEADELRTSIPAPPPPPTNQVSLADFAVLRPLGSGTFGKVWMVRYKGDNMVYAMKIMAKKSIYSENMSKHVRLEKEILATIGNHSPFVVGLRFAFQTPRTLCLVIEYLSGGSLFHHLRESEKPYSKEVARFYAVEILLALEALHTADFIYRDLKLENCLLDEEGHLRLTDFGLSRRLTPRLRRVRSYSGSNIYVAPEVLADNAQIGHGKTVDWWGYGVLLHLLLTQQAPFWSDNNDELFAMIKEGDPPDFTQYSFLDNDTVSLLSQLLERDPTKRLGYTENDQGATGAQQVKNHPFFAGIDWVAAASRKMTPPFVPPAEYALKYSMIEGPEDNISDQELNNAGSPEDIADDLPNFYFQISMLQPPPGSKPLPVNPEEQLFLLCRVCGQHVPEDQVKTHSAQCLATASNTSTSTSSGNTSTSTSSGNTSTSTSSGVAPSSSNSVPETSNPAASASTAPVPPEKPTPPTPLPRSTPADPPAPLPRSTPADPPAPLPRSTPADADPVDADADADPPVDAPAEITPAEPLPGAPSDDFGIDATLNLEI